MSTANAGETGFQKPVANPEHISLLVPTRGRLQPFHRMLDSLQAQTARPQLVDVWVYIDDDDEIMNGARAAGQFTGFQFKVNFHSGPGGMSQGSMINKLWRICESKAGIFMGAVDDYLFVMPGWDERVRAAFKQYPDRIALVYPVDPTAAKDQVTFMIVSAEWANLAGRLMTEYFPAWFDDVWLDEVAQFAQRKTPIDVRMQPQGGKGLTPRLRNLPFWTRFFDCLREDRLLLADKILAAIHGQDTEAYRRAALQARKLAVGLALKYASSSDEKLRLAEQTWSGRAAPEVLAKIPQYYWNLEKTACLYLLKKLQSRLESGGPAAASLPLLAALIHALHFQGEGRPIPAPAPAPARLQIPPAVGPKTAGMDVGRQSEVARAIGEVIGKNSLCKLIETGTHLGTGTTAIIASALRKHGLVRSVFYSIECNPEFFRQAHENLLRAGLASFVRQLQGLSLPRRLLPTLQQIEQACVKCSQAGISADYSENERVARYFQEANFPNEPDDRLGECLKAFDFRPDFVLLDSAGHLGAIEFDYLLQQLKGECFIALDDIFHIKHCQSYLGLKDDPRFKVLALSRERFGFCLVRYTPA